MCIRDREVPLSNAVWQMGRIAGMTRGLETGDLALIADANDDRLQEPYRRALIPDYDAIRATCLDGGAGTLWISGSGSTLMAVTDDTIVAKFLQVRLREAFPACETHIPVSYTHLDVYKRQGITRAINLRHIAELDICHTRRSRCVGSHYELIYPQV